MVISVNSICHLYQLPYPGKVLFLVICVSNCLLARLWENGNSCHCESCRIDRIWFEIIPL